VVSLALDILTVAFIVVTMLAAGLASRLEALARLGRDLRLAALVFAANLIVIPLLGWGLGAAFALGAPAATALCLFAASPGGPLGTRFAMLQGGDVEAGATAQLALAVAGSVTFAPTAGLLLDRLDTGAGVTVSVPALIVTVVVLQLVPFAAGLWVRRVAERAAVRTVRVLGPLSTGMFALVITGLVVANSDAVSAVFTSRTAAADVVFIAACFVVGLAFATGSSRRRTTLGSVAATRNMGPALAAVALSLDGDPAVQGPLVSVVLLSVILGLAAAAGLSRRRAAEDSAPA
jgi:bile acid:Na+ symporter, BASS family